MAQVQTEQRTPFQDLVTSSIRRHQQSLEDINHQIHSNPEIRYEEYQAHDNICNLLSGLGYRVTPHAYGIETSLEAESGQGGRLITFNAEYDALPGLGHACGHNLIAVSGVAVAVALKAAIDKHNVSAKIILLGTPGRSHLDF